MPGRRRFESSQGSRSPALFALALLAFVLPVLLTGPAAALTQVATTMYVDKANNNCSDTGSGTASKPFCTISAAAALTTKGTTVLVSTGTYLEQVSVRSGASGSPVTFAAADGAFPTVTGAKFGFYVSGKSFVTIRGFNVTATTSDGVHVSSGSKNINVIENRVSYTGQPVSGKTAKGISITDGSDVLVQDNIVDHISNFGIYVQNSTRIVIVGNNVSQNAKQYERAASGIRLHASDANTISSNVSHDNEDSGIEVVTGSDNNLVVNNVTYGNGDHGIDVLDSVSQRIVSNSVYDNVTAGINVEGTSTGATLANNISVDNGLTSTRTRGNIRVDSASTTGTTLDFDFVYLTIPGTMFVWGASSYSSLDAFFEATGREGNGMQADPRWVAPASGNLRLTAASPAIDSANSGASGHSVTDADGNPRADDSNTTNVGVGPRAYDDRGAYEFQPPDYPPAAALTVTPSSGFINLTVTADASASSDTDSTPIASYTFNFGDGTPAVGPQPGATAPHTYTVAGTYTVTVTVTDTAGLSGTDTRQVTVRDDPPIAALTVTPDSGTINLAVTADASASTDPDATPIASYTFNFGDGSPAVGPQPGATAPHTYTVAGTYTVTVTVRDTAGLSSTATSQVIVRDDPPTAALTVTPASGLAPLNVTADASGSSDTDATPIASYTFKFGDGTPVVGPQPSATATHSYLVGGTYTATVTVTDAANQSSTATAQVVVSVGAENPPVAALTVTPPSGPINLNVTADASASTDPDPSSQIATYTFKFGDGSLPVGPQAGATATHTYTVPGTYTVAVTVTDTAGISSTATQEVTVRDDPPNAVLAVTPDSGPLNLAVTADASASTDPDATPIASYTFDFGDGSPAVGPQPGATATHTYTAVGTYAVTVTVRDTAGLSSTATRQVTVRDDPPTAALTVNPSSGSAPLEVTADASASTDTDATPIASYTFDFGDGTPTVGPQPGATATHTYAAGGTFTVTVTVRDMAGLSSTATAQVVARANLIGNPGFETDTSGWNTSGGGAGITLTRVSGGYGGDWAAKLTNTSTAATTCTLNDSPNWVKTTATGTYTASLWVRADAAGATLKLRLREYAGSTLVGSATTQVTLTTSWQHVTVTHVPASAGASSLDYNAYATGVPPGTCFYADDVSIELS